MVLNQETLDNYCIAKAIEEMTKSRSEHGDRADPLVGAVLADKDGNVLGFACRARLRDGDHAEFTLIERFLANQDLEGTTLYVTLEPCTMRRTKTPCVDHIINARISKVIIGLPDPNPNIHMEGITKLLDSGIDVSFFPPDKRKEIEILNSSFMESFSEAESTVLDSLGSFEGLPRRELETVTEARDVDLSQDALRKYLVARKQNLEIPSTALCEFLSRNGYMRFDDSLHVYVPTVAGLIVFGQSPEDFMPECRISVEVEIGNKRMTREIGGPLINSRQEALDIIENNMRLFTEIDRDIRVEVPEYPIEAIREILTNALVHREYLEGARVSIKLLRDRLIISSPGAPVPPLTMDGIRRYDAPPINRNPRIAIAFNHMKWMEERGWGLQNVKSSLEKHGLKAPEFRLDTGYFIVTIFGESESASFRISEKLSNTLTESQVEVLDFVANKGIISTSQCAKQLDVSPSTVKRRLGELIELGLVEKKGQKVKTKYKLVELIKSGK